MPIAQVGSQSAISQLLASLTQPQPSAIPGAPAMPQPGQMSPGQIPVGNMSAPPPQAPPLNVPMPPDNSITGRIRALLSGAQSGAQNLLTGSAPQGYQSLLSPQEMQQDRPGILESILGGGIFAPLVGRMMYQNNLAQNVNMNQLAEQIQSQRLSMAQNARVLQARNQMASLFPLSQNPSLDELRTNLAKQYDYAISHGDVEMAKDIGARLNDVLKVPAAPRDARNDLKPANFVVNGRPVAGFVDGYGNRYDSLHQPITTGDVTPYQATPTPQASFTAPTGLFGPNGRPMILNTKTGQLEEAPPGTTRQGSGAGTGNLPAPMAAKVGQFGELLKKTPDILSAMDGLTVGLPQSAAADIAEHGLAGIPGTKGIGNLMLNREPQYARYNAALAPWVLAAAHAISGARINQQQVDQIYQSVRIEPGDLKNPSVIAQKRKNLIDLVNSIAGSLPESAVSAQEAQMPPEVFPMLTGAGYEFIGARPDGGGSASGVSTDEAAKRTAWMQSHPRKPGETNDQWRQRYLASGGTQ
ncbi:MAG: hypothetical protein KGI71_05365 [Patescibacteria group bacterium]|nr:hypothetical protein [Patescibacteria group bacterium]